MRYLLALVLSGCTLVVGSDPSVDTDAAGVEAAPAEEGSPPPPKKDAEPPDDPVKDAGTDVKTCDAGGCNAAKDVCKKACGAKAKSCNDACDDDKACHDLCNKELGSCNMACLTACLQCVMGCGTCGP